MQMNPNSINDRDESTDESEVDSNDVAFIIMSTLYYRKPGYKIPIKVFEMRNHLVTPINLLTTAIICLTFFVFTSSISSAQDQSSSVNWGDHVGKALEQSGENRSELEKALAEIEKSQKPAMQFLIANMPKKDLESLTAKFRLEHVRLAYEAREKTPWGKSIPEELFFNDVVAYANVNEKREAWRSEMFAKAWPIVKECKTPAEAAQKLNEQLFGLVKVRYSTKRKRPDQAPSESIEQGVASCTGLSILLSDACRSVCVPARLAGTPMWTNKRGNHTWVEIWDGKWHFTGACEPSKQGLNHGWFVNDASQAKKDSRIHAIYATSFQKTDSYFPLAWNRRDRTVPAVNVTERYNALAKPKKSGHRLMVRVVGNDGTTRVKTFVKVSLSGTDKSFSGSSKDESADTNDFLTFDAELRKEYLIEVFDAPEGKLLASQKVKTGTEKQSITTLKLK